MYKLSCDFEEIIDWLFFVIFQRLEKDFRRSFNSLPFIGSLNNEKVNRMMKQESNVLQIAGNFRFLRETWNNNFRALVTHSAIAFTKNKNISQSFSIQGLATLSFSPDTWKCLTVNNATCGLPSKKSHKPFRY